MREGVMIASAYAKSARQRRRVGLFVFCPWRCWTPSQQPRTNGKGRQLMER